MTAYDIYTRDEGYESYQGLAEGSAQCRQYVKELQHRGYSTVLVFDTNGELNRSMSRGINKNKANSQPLMASDI